MLTPKWKTIALLCTLTAACDQASDEPSWRDDEPELAIDEADDVDAIDRERVEEAFARQPWDDALNELLELECDGRDHCKWAPPDLEAVGLQDLADELSEPPAKQVQLQPSDDLTAAPDPSAVFDKQVYLTSIRCVDQQEAFSDEPYLQVGGSSIWNAGDVDDGESFNIGQVHGFNTQLFIDLWELDPGPSNDDHIGSTLTVLAADNGEYVHTFKGSDGEYRLYYTVSNWGT